MANMWDVQLGKVYALGIFRCRVNFKKIRTTHYACLLMMAPSHPRDGRAFTDYGEWLYSLRKIANFLETSRILSERSQRQLKVHVLPSEPYRGTFYSPICRAPTPSAAPRGIPQLKATSGQENGGATDEK